LAWRSPAALLSCLSAAVCQQAGRLCQYRPDDAECQKGEQRQPVGELLAAAFSECGCEGQGAHTRVSVDRR
jgi:hypothetical protein